MSDAQLEAAEQNPSPEPEPTGLVPKRKMHYSGKVLKLTLAGAIVDIGLEKPAVLHISRMSQENINRPDELLEVGETIDVWVQRIDPTSDLVELTMIQPLALEWRDIKKGMQVAGSVVRLEKFGAFVEIGAERPGLVHVSEITQGYIREPGEVLKVGEEVEAQVIGVDRRKKRIQLSMKALEPTIEESTRGGRSGGRKNIVEEEEEIDDEPVPTAMEFAMRQALGQTKDEELPIADQKARSGSAPRAQDELEEILSKTLEQEVQSS
ncbi:MAG: S1 RNA-binding domain-containing protein [Anaerolineales bacterium]|nr:S1 RNA-binding domain-containing protein [Anaerolineales bacterium]